MADKEGKGLGAKIRRLREQAGLSQSELGEKLGVSYQQIQKYERGVNRFSVETLVKLARALDVPAAGLLEGGEAKGASVNEARPEYAAPRGREERELLKGFRDIADEKLRAALLALVKAAAGKKHG
jgi:transcriptional regulator with XRE-family HTH domain